MPTDVKAKPKRFQIKRGKPFPPDSKSVARSTVFGNPFTVQRFGRGLVVHLHRKWLEGTLYNISYLGFTKSEIQELAEKRVKVLERLPELRGQHLG